MADIEIRVTPRASGNRVGPLRDGILHVRVTRPPADGEANASVLRLVADAIDEPPSRLHLVAGERSRRKRLRVDGVSAEELHRRLTRLGAD